MSMSKQEIFTRVAVHLLRQGEPSMNSGQCQYRGPNGLKCAVGVLIPDELCTPSFLEFENGAGVMSADVQKALITAGVLREDDFASFIFLRDLQIIHDTCPPTDWQEGLGALAIYSGLQMPNLNDIAALEALPALAETELSTTKEGATHE